VRRLGRTGNAGSKMKNYAVAMIINYKDAVGKW